MNKALRGEAAGNFGGGSVWGALGSCSVSSGSVDRESISFHSLGQFALLGSHSVRLNSFHRAPLSVRFQSIPILLRLPGRLSCLPVAMNHGKDRRHEEQRRDRGKQQTANHSASQG